MPPLVPDGPAVVQFATLLSMVGVTAGVWSVVARPATLGDSRRSHHAADLGVRIAHSLRDVSAVARSQLNPRIADPVGIAGLVLSPWWTQAANWLDRMVGGSDQVALERAGLTISLDEYRFRRLMAVCLGVIAGALAGLTLGLRAEPHPLVLAGGLAGVGGVAALWLFDRHLRSLWQARKERLIDEFPTVLELLSLALSAGESLPGAIRRIASRGSGELAREWSRVMRMVDVGAPLGTTLVDSAHSLGVPELEALTEHLRTALERGAPLAEVVRSHSSDSRLQRLRGIVDRAGKAEVAMLVPLVLMILPVTVIFAVWPSLQALQLGI